MQETKIPTSVVEDTYKESPPEVKPKSSCRHCHGRGHEGVNFSTKKPIICRCVRRSFEQVNKIKKEQDAKLKASKITPNKGWNAGQAVLSQ